jgi:hypothetical protein
LDAVAMKRDLLVLQLSELILAQRQAHPLRVGFDGVDAAGKTTLANEVAQHLNGCGRQIIRASMASTTREASGIVTCPHIGNAWLARPRQSLRPTVRRHFDHGHPRQRW